MSNFVGLILFIFIGYVAAMFVLTRFDDPVLAVLCGCLVTSLSQRVYTVTGRYK